MERDLLIFIAGFCFTSIFIVLGWIILRIVTRKDIKYTTDNEEFFYQQEIEKLKNKVVK